MPRLLFTKVGESVWMSHLDLMRLMQRAFKRAGFALKHTQGYNPRPSVSIALSGNGYTNSPSLTVLSGILIRPVSKHSVP